MGNSWDNGSFGNYWSDYKGSDANSDGIDDSLYYINSNNQDNYPLINQVSLPKGTSTSAPTSEPHPTEPTTNPAIPELSWLAILPLLLSVFSIALLFRHRKTGQESLTKLSQECFTESLLGIVKQQ